MADRRKVATVYNLFDAEIERLLRLDAQNQLRFRPGPGRPGHSNMSKRQMIFITEAIFLRAFSSYELFLEETFLLYTQGKPTRAGRTVPSCITPKNTTHAREIMKSHMNFLEWNDADKIITRSNIYLNDNSPIKRALAANLTKLRYMRQIRNAVAHRSPEAFTKFGNVVQAELRAPPLSMPEPGEFLQMIDPVAPPTYFLLSYLNILKTVADNCSA